MPRTASEIADFLQAVLEGDGSILLSGVASPESAGRHDLIYVASARHLDRAAKSTAGCAIVGEGLLLQGKTLIRSAQPKLAFAKAAALLVPPVRIAVGIHPSCVVAASARLAPGVSVGPFAVIEDDVVVGEGTEIGAFCFLGGGSKVGAHCRLFPRVTLYPGVCVGDRAVVHSGAVLGSDGFGFVFGEGKNWKFPQLGGVEIADDVEIGSNTTIDRGSLGTTRIAADVKLDNLIQVAHNVSIGEHSVVAAQTGISGSSDIEKRVVIGGQVGIGVGCTIQDGAMIGSQAGILSGKTIYSGQVVWGTPARPLARFKELYAWFGRLPELAERVRRLERLVLKD